MRLPTAGLLRRPMIDNRILLESPDSTSPPSPFAYDHSHTVLPHQRQRYWTSGHPGTPACCILACFLQSRRKCRRVPPFSGCQSIGFQSPLGKLQWLPNYTMVLTPTSLGDETSGPRFSRNKKKRPTDRPLPAACTAYPLPMVA